MINTDIDQIGLDNLSSDYKTKNGVGICFFDPYDETLKEFNNSTKIPIYPSEVSVRKFYIVRDDYNLAVNTVIAKVRSNSATYSVKATTDPNADFSVIPENNVVLDFFSKYSNGIIPFLLEITSVSTNLEDVSLTIDLEVN